MDWQGAYWLVGICIAVLTVYNTIISIGRKSGATDAQLARGSANEENWTLRFDALANALSLHQANTSDRFERVVEKLNDALLTMAREHPTKADLHQIKVEILDRIDAHGEPQPLPRRRKAVDHG
jgi:hypothetical protein